MPKLHALKHRKNAKNLQQSAIYKFKVHLKITYYIVNINFIWVKILALQMGNLRVIKAIWQKFFIKIEPKI